MTYKSYISLALFLVLLFSCNRKENAIAENNNVFVDEDSIESSEAEYAFGFKLNDYIVERDTIQRGDNLGLILGRHSFDATDIRQITDKIKDSFDIRNIKAGNIITVLKSKTNPPKLEILIYEPNAMGFSVIDFRDSTSAYKVNYPVSYKVKTVAGIIDGSLSASLRKEGLDPGLAKKLASQFAWSIDFFKFQKGDRFAVSVQEKYINDTIYIGTEKVLGAYFQYKGKAIYGFPYSRKGSKNVDFYDENGKQMRTMFLKSPLKFFQITSKFSKNRFHPVQKKWKAHNGTDYAAPHGTPIMTTASGTVIETGYTGGNGNYVKVKHDATYTTQYLHMSKILVKRGQQVQQGQVIGRVGSTGLATGPHVCYRFWRNGVQVDPLRLQLPTSQLMDSKELPLYLQSIQSTKKDIDHALTEKFRS